MDRDVEGCTVQQGFLFDVLKYYETGWKREAADELFKMVEGLERDKPGEHVPLKRYNDLCRAIEERFGPGSIRSAGQDIGGRVYDHIVSVDAGTAPTPESVIRGMAAAAQVLVHDPKGRGFEIVDVSAHHMRIRYTATFNCILQEGLIETLISRTGARLPRVTQTECARNGADACLYDVTWHDPRQS